MAYTPAADCFDAANKASGEKLTRAEINAAFQRIVDHKERLKASGDITGMADKLKSFAEREAERTRIAAAMQRRHAALNILVRDRQNQAIDGFLKAGLKPREALLAVMEGTQKNVEGGRNSIAALTLAYEGRYIGGLLAELQAKMPHLSVSMLRDQRFDSDVFREMYELREGGAPGRTGNKDAQQVARIFATYAELSRTDLNRLGALIGKLDGWAGAQGHDDFKMIAAGKAAWIDSILPKLDIARTFPDVENAADLNEAMEGIYDTIITGLPNKPTPREKGQRVNPANLAKSLGKSRVLHFRDAEAALAYRAEFGYGNTISSMVSHLRNASRTAANMEALGPNPEVMLGSMVDGLARKVKDDPNLSPAEKQKQTKGLSLDGGALRHALDVSTGLISRPVNVTGAKIGSEIRAVESMAKLGGSVISSMSDVITASAASQFRGSGFFKGLVRQLDGMRRGRPKGEVAEISYLIGEGFDGIVGHIVAPAAANDGAFGFFGRQLERFFRWNGQSWWTDIARSTAGRTISAEMAMRAKVGYAELPANYRHVLGLHGITEAKWDAIRQAGVRQANGQSYITPELALALDDDVIEPLVKARIDAARKATKLDEAKSAETKAKRQAQFNERRTAILNDGRRDLQLSLLRFFADETNYGVIEVDNRAKRMMSWGTRPGTMAGEALRFIMQFKGFPTAFMQRVGGRALYGHSKDASFLHKAAHMGSLLGGLTMSGYMAMTMKDMMRGYWPPRDPSDPATMAAAFVQGGAAGIYGDFLFGQTNRFGSGPLETLAGPTIGSAADLIEIGLKARDAAVGTLTGSEAKMPKAQALTWAVNNTPFVNLFYTRPVLDYLFLNSWREGLSPGYLKRQEKRRRTDYGQQTVPFLGDRRAFN